MFGFTRYSSGASRRAVCLLVPSILLSIYLVSELNAQNQNFVPGQALAKFVAGSPGDAAATKAAQASPPDLGVLAPAISDLESGVGLPLLATQVSSGNWFIVSVNLDRLAERTVRRLRDRDSVTDVKAGAREGEDAGNAPALLEMRPKFAHDSPEFKIIAEARSRGPEDEQLAALISTLQNALDLPLHGTATGPGELVLQVDLGALTLQLVERLGALPQIEAAQPNYIVGAMGTVR